MEISMSQIAELAGMGIPVFIGCSVIVGNGDNLQNCFAKHDKLAVEEPVVGLPDHGVKIASTENFELPAELTKPEIIETLEMLQRKKALDARFQPIGMSITKKGMLASLLADKFEIENPWIVFGKLWNMNKETLRSGCNKAILQPNSDEVRKELKSLIA